MNKTKPYQIITIVAGFLFTIVFFSLIRAFKNQKISIILLLMFSLNGSDRLMYLALSTNILLQ